mgnify:FL=1
MNTYQSRFCSILVLLGLGVANSSSAVEIERRQINSYQTQPPSNSSRGNQTQSSANNSLWELYQQIQSLQNEVLELRGLVDQQNYAIEQLKSKQKQLYTDLDQRLQASSSQSASVNEDDVNESAPNELKAPDEAQKTLYKAALSAIKAQDYERARQQLEDLVETDPEGFYAPTAYFWLGEVAAAQQPADLEQAVTQFTKVAETFPEHNKASTSLYKLGQLHGRLGNPDEAKQQLETLIQRYPESREAELAKSYLKQL